MTRRRKLMQQRLKQLSSQPSSSFSNRQQPFSRKQRRRIRQRLRRQQQRRRKIRNRSMSMTTQIATDALDMLHISTESNIKPFEFIERYELTRYDALAMPFDQRPIVCLLRPNNSRVFSTTTNELSDSISEDNYSSYA